MTTGTGDIARSADAGGSGDFAAAWQAMRADPDLQFAPIELPPPSDSPGWLRAMIEAIVAFARRLGPLGTVLFWALLALGAVAIALLVWRIAAPLIARRRVSAANPDPAWVPDRGETEALLDDADQLAAQGRFDEAAHLLLQRSVQQIRAVQPDWLAPSSTAREIAGLAALSEPARRAFGIIAQRVERCLFAMRPLDAGDWQAARGAYADFALARL